MAVPPVVLPPPSPPPAPDATFCWWNLAPISGG